MELQRTTGEWQKRGKPLEPTMDDQQWLYQALVPNPPLASSCFSSIILVQWTCIFREILNKKCNNQEFI